MSRLAEYRKLEEQLKAQMAELEAMRNDKSLKKDMEFEDKLRSLMGEYNIALPSLINILDPQLGTRRAPVQQGQTPRRTRQVKTYKNPHSGEVVETKGGNHKVLKSWKAEYGADEVEGWIQ